MKKNRTGFTLVELMLVVALIGVVSSVAYSIFFTGQKSFEVGMKKGEEQADHRILREYLVKELRYIQELYLKDPVGKGLIKYYSLKVEKKEEEKYQLVKKTYINDKEQPGEQIIPVYFDRLDISITSGIVTINFYPVDSQMTSRSNTPYKFTIALENKNKLGGNIVLNSLDPSLQSLYYVYSSEEIDEWNETTLYQKGAKVRYNNRIFISRIDNVKLWAPGAVHSIWQEITDEWRWFNFYNKDDIVCYNTNKYKSIINNNVNFEPGKTHTSWQEVTDEWRSFNRYQKDDIVKHNGSTYISTHVGENIWEPGSVGVDDRIWKKIN